MTSLFRYIVFFVALLFSSLGNAQKATIDSTQLGRSELKSVEPIQLSSKLSMNELIDMVHNEMESPLHAVESIYYWMVVNLKYDYKAKDSDDYKYQNDPIIIYKKKTGICSEFVCLFNHLMNELGILSVEVVGYCKDCETSDDKYEAPTHAWNAIFLDSTWYMMDVTWDICLSKDNKGKFVGISDKYFLKTADEMLLDHLPAIPIWQLNDSIISIDEYRSSVSIHEKLVREYYKKNFLEEIESYLKLTPFKQKLWEDEASFNFNPTEKNGSAYAHRLLDYAGILSDSLESIDQKINAKIYADQLKQIIDLCAQADKLSELHKWQNEMYAGTLINYVIFQYNNPDIVNEWNTEKWKLLLNEIRRAKFILQRFDESYYKAASIEHCDEIIEVILPHIEE